MPVDPSWAPPYPGEAVVESVPKASLVDVLSDVGVILGGMVVIGIVCGFVWSRVVTPPQLIRFETSIGQDELQLSRVFAMDGWYAIVAAGGGLLGGITFGLLRKRDALVTLLLILVGCVAAAFLMKVTGHVLGPDDPSAALRKAAVGTHAEGQLELNSFAPYLAWPLGALFGALIPLLSRSD